MFNMVKVFKIFSLPLTIQLFLIFFSDVCCQEDDKPNTSYYDPLTKLSSWYESHVSLYNVHQVLEFVGLFRDIKTAFDKVLAEKRQALDEKRQAFDAAFAYSCYLSSRKQLDFISKFHFPLCLWELKMDRRFTWEAFFSLEPETFGQKRYQNRLREKGNSPFTISNVINHIYTKVPEVTHPTGFQKFLDGRKFKELLPQCCALLGLETEMGYGTNAMKVIMEPEPYNSKEEKNFHREHWNVARIIRIKNLHENVLNRDIKSCLNRCRTDKTIQKVKCHYFTALWTTPVHLIEYFSSDYRNNTQLMDMLKECKLGNLNSLMNDEDDFMILPREFESAGSLPWYKSITGTDDSE